MGGGSSPATKVWALLARDELRVDVHACEDKWYRAEWAARCFLVVNERGSPMHHVVLGVDGRFEEFGSAHFAHGDTARVAGIETHRVG
jgi:hypothetical protein